MHGQGLAKGQIPDGTPTSTEQPYPSALHGWITVSVLTFFYVLSLLDRNILSLLIEPIKRDLGISDVRISLLYGAAFAVSYALGSLPVGWAVDRYGRRPLLFAGVAFWSLATACCGIARGFGGLAAARSCVGIGESVVIPTGQSLIADSFPPNRLALPMSIYGAGAKLGGGVSLVVGSVLVLLIDPYAAYQLPVVGETRGWQLVFLAVGLPGIFLAFLAFAIREPNRRNDGASGVRKVTGYGDYVRFFSANWRFLLSLHLGQMLVTAVVSAVSTWGVPIFSRVHDWSASQSGFVLGPVLTIAPLLCVPIHGLLVDRAHSQEVPGAHTRHLAITCLLAAPFALAAFLVHDYRLSLLFIAIAMMLTVGYVGVSTAALALLVPSNLLGKAAAVQVLLVTLAGYTLGSTGPALISDLIFNDPGKIGVAVSIYTSICLVIAAGAFVLTRRSTPVSKQG